MCGIENMTPKGLLYGEDTSGVIMMVVLGLGLFVSPEQADFPEAQCEAFWRMKQGLLIRRAYY
jgi:hypothetical protein